MSSYNPPIENLPVFDTILFREANGDTLTRGEADRRYLRFPIGQGNETLPANLSVSGTTNLGLTNITNNSLVISDGIDTNTITKLGYTTKNSVEATNHFLNFSNSSVTGVGAIQKSANFVVVPSTGALTTSGPANLAKKINSGSVNQFVEVDTGAATSFIDFHSNINFVTDFDARIEVTGGTTNFSGTATIDIVANNTTINGGLTMGGANNITLGSGTTAPTIGKLGYIYSTAITWSGGAGNGIGAITLAAGTYTGTFAVILAGVFVANNYIEVSNLGYIARFPIINSVSGATYTAMCNGSFTINITTATTLTLSNGILNAQSLYSSNYRIVKIA